MTHELPMRIGTPGDWPAISRLSAASFNEAWDEDMDRVERDIFEPDRSLVISDGDRMVAHAGVFTRDMTVPGAVLPAAHVTMVSVAATHRRRGLLRRLMVQQLADVRTAGEPFAVLWASEGRIYQRFGYGLAAAKLGLEIDTREVSLPAAGPASAESTLRSAEPMSVLTEISKVYDQQRGERPGWSARHDATWAYLLADLPVRRGGASELRCTLHEGPSGVDGYALWRGKASWDSAGPKGETQIREVVATTTAGYVALWRHLLTIDLNRSTRMWFAATDEPLVHLVNEPRRLGAYYGDALWVRLVDVRSALAGRRYATPVDVTVEVSDAILPENAGVWRLRADASGVSVERTTGAPDLTCDVSALGAAYLGGATLGQLAAAGRVTELRTGTLAPASAAFGWHRAPSAQEIF